MLFGISDTKICLCLCLLLLGISSSVCGYTVEKDTVSIDFTNTANTSDQLDLLLDAIANSNSKVVDIIDEYKPIALQICNDSSIKNCHTKFYEVACHQLSLVKELKSELASLVLEWKKWSSTHHDILGKAYVQFYLSIIDLYNNDAEKFLSKILSAKDLLNQTDDYPLLSFRIENKLGRYYRNIGEFHAAKACFSRGLDVAIRLNDSISISTAYTNFGRLYRKKSMYDSARYYHTKSFNIENKINNYRGIALTSNNLGNIYHIEGNLEKALVYYIKSKDAKERQQNQQGLCVSYHNIGAVRLDLKQYDLALVEFEKSLALANEQKMEILQIHNLNKIGCLYRALGDIQKAIVSHQSANDIAKKINYDEGLVESNINLGEDLLEQELYLEAFNYFKTGLNLAEKNDRKNFISTCLIHIAECYLGIKKNNASVTNAVETSLATNVEVEQMLLKGTQIAQEIGSYENTLTALEALRKFYKERKKYRQEAEISEIYLNYLDSLHEQQSTNAIAEWSSKYETAEKEKEISVLEASEEKSAARIRFWSVISILLFAIIGIGSYLFIQLQIVRRKLTVQNNELNELNQTKDRFFSIIAHDIRSPIVALESVGEQMDFYIKKNHTDKLTQLGGLVGKTSKHLNSLLDNLLNWALVQTKSMPYHPEMIVVSDVWKETADLMHANAQLKHIKLVSEVSSNLKVYADLPSFSTILRNLTSNALKFSEPNTTVIFKATKGKKEIKFEVIDQGVGMSHELVSKLFSLEKKSKKGTADERGTGLGLILCKDLVELNKGTISVKSTKGKGSTFHFIIPDTINSI